MSVTQGDFTRAVLDPDIARPNGLTDCGGSPAGRRFDVFQALHHSR